MSSTRSPSQKAQVTELAAVIVSHGQPSDPDPAEAALAALANDVARALPGWQIGSATLAKSGSLAAALDHVGPEPLIYPMFMTSGWFTSDELRKRLGASKARVLAPLGVDPGLPAMAAGLLRRHLGNRGWQAADTTLFIAAHGSGRSRNSSRDTNAFAKVLANLITLKDIRVGFVEEAPYLADKAMGLGPKAICLPFFAAEGGHVIQDIPEALDKARFQGLCLDPIGILPEVPGLIAQALTEACTDEKLTA